jgi:hypothetical protein
MKIVIYGEEFEVDEDIEYAIWQLLTAITAKSNK